MEIAVSVDRGGGFIAKCELYNRLGARLEALPLTAAAGLQIYPSDAVLLCHRMRNRTDRDLDNVTLALNYGNMLLVACFNRSGLQQLHFLTAAHHGNACVVNETYDISTMLAYIKFVFTHVVILRIFLYYFLLYRFKVCSTVLAKGANIIFGKLLALVYESAYLANIAFLSLCLRLGLNIAMIISICHSLAV